MAGLEYASGVTAQCVGKPEPTFYRTVLEDIGCRAEETVMIGDVSVSRSSNSLTGCWFSKT